MRTFQNYSQTSAIAIVAPLPPPYGGMAVQAQKLHDRLHNEGVNVLFIPTNPAFPNILSVLEKVKGVRTFVRFVLFSFGLTGIKQAKVVHVFAASHLYFFLVVIPTIALAKILNKKTVLNYRGGEAEVFFKKWGKVIVPFIKMADTVAVPSTFLQKVFRQYLRIEPIILPNLADIEKFKFRERKTIKPVLVVSRQLEPLYNHECILHAFKLVKALYPEAVLKIVGTGSEESQLKSLQKKVAIEGIEFIGELSHEQLASVYDECDIMVNASRADNFPGAILEAFMCGLPVVTTRVGGIPYMVEDGKTGILVDPDDHEGLAHGVISLIQDPLLYQKLSINGRRMATEYSWEKIKNNIFRMYGFYDKECSVKS